MTPADTPERLRLQHGLPVLPTTDGLAELKFSLGEMQMEFSMLRQGERYTLNIGGNLGNYIMKPPSKDFEALPRIEVAMMETVRAAGIEVPEVALLAAEQINGLPDMSGYREREPFYAIRCFDRPDDSRAHVEDFAQVFNLRSAQKYGRVNYEMIALTLLRYTGGLPDLKEMTQRLVLNVLLGNGDAHIKNWSLLYYENLAHPRLAPAYGLVPTVAYAAWFTRIGRHDHTRDELLEEVRATTRRVAVLLCGSGRFRPPAAKDRSPPTCQPIDCVRQKVKSNIRKRQKVKTHFLPGYLGV
ncbi:MAG: HipA domain-containing protein [Zoogloeaceae bacterium]|nr:HipA domain-containing protein [Zoogloeaceae bacterium]